MSFTRDIAFVGGLISVGVGLYCIYHPLVWIWAGAWIMLTTAAAAWRAARDN